VAIIRYPQLQKIQEKEFKATVVGCLDSATSKKHGPLKSFAEATLIIFIRLDPGNTKHM